MLQIFIVREDTTYRHKEFLRRRQIRLDDTIIWIVSPEDLIISKLFWAKDSLSDIQMNDVKKLLMNLKELDKEYICEWVKKLEIEQIYDRVKINE